jgi:hypothetical protein
MEISTPVGRCQRRVTAAAAALEEILDELFQVEFCFDICVFLEGNFADFSLLRSVSFETQHSTFCHLQKSSLLIAGHFSPKLNLVLSKPRNFR